MNLSQINSDIIYLKKIKFIKLTILTGMGLIINLCSTVLYAQASDHIAALKEQVYALLAPKETPANQINLNTLSNFNYTNMFDANAQQTIQTMTLYQAIAWVLQHHPEITQALANISSQNAYIDSAKAAYYPQISGGISTADITKSNRGAQLLSLNAAQMLYDFGKTKASIGLQEAKTLKEHANLLVVLDRMSQQVAENIIQIKRYQALEYISQQQILGIQRLVNITQLRAKAGISSQADPVQAQSYLEAAQTDLIIQQTQKRIYQQRLNTLLGFNADHIAWEIPTELIQDVLLLNDPQVNQLPKMMLAHTEIQIAQLQQQEKKLEIYPTIQLKAEVSQAINGDHPATAKNNDLESRIMFEANSLLYQGGANKSQQRALNYAVEAAQARMNETYLEIQDNIQLSRQQIIQKQKQMTLAGLRAKTTAKTKELYEEQYKLGTRTAVDLLNAEQAIHTVAQEIETIRYDIYTQMAIYIEATASSKHAYHLHLDHIQGVKIQP